MKRAAFPSSGRELNKVLTYFLIFLLAFTLRRGLMTLIILRGLRFTLTAIISRRLIKNYEVYNLPSDYDNKIDCIPSIAKIGPLIKDETHGNYLY
jgi:hypothetical protein